MRYAVVVEQAFYREGVAKLYDFIEVCATVKDKETAESKFREVFQNCTRNLGRRIPVVLDREYYYEDGGAVFLQKDSFIIDLLDTTGNYIVGSIIPFDPKAPWVCLQRTEDGLIIDGLPAPTLKQLGQSSNYVNLKKEGYKNRFIGD